MNTECEEITVIGTCFAPALLYAVRQVGQWMENKPQRLVHGSVKRLMGGLVKISQPGPLFCDDSGSLANN